MTNLNSPVKNYDLLGLLIISLDFELYWGIKLTPAEPALIVPKC